MKTSLEGERGPTAAATGEDRDRGRARLAGILLIASPLLWILGVAPFRSQIGGFYDYYQDDPLRAVNDIAGNGGAWIAQTLLFFVGTLAAVAGLVILGLLLRGTAAEPLSRVGIVGALGVGALNAWAAVLRLITPTDGVKTKAEIPALLIQAHTGWLNFVTIVLTVLTLLVFAAAMFRLGMSKVGVVVGGLSALVLVAVVGQGSLPPVIVFPIAGVLGGGTLVAGPLRSGDQVRL